MNPYQLIFYRTPQGKVPCQRWLEGLKDMKGLAKIQTRLNRLSLGYQGDSKPLKSGVKELRIDLRAWLSGLFCRGKDPNGNQDFVVRRHKKDAETGH